MTTYRFTSSEAVFDVTLEYDAVGLGESEGFVHGLESIAIWSKCWEDRWVQWATE